MHIAEIHILFSFHFTNLRKMWYNNIVAGLYAFRKCRMTVQVFFDAPEAGRQKKSSADFIDKIRANIVNTVDFDIFIWYIYRRKETN